MIWLASPFEFLKKEEKKKKMKPTNHTALSILVPEDLTSQIQEIRSLYDKVGCNSPSNKNIHLQFILNSS